MTGGVALRMTGEGLRMTTCLRTVPEVVIAVEQLGGWEAGWRGR